MRVPLNIPIFELSTCQIIMVVLLQYEVTISHYHYRQFGILEPRFEPDSSLAV